jgi:hypothetical protein
MFAAVRGALVATASLDGPAALWRAGPHDRLGVLGAHDAILCCVAIGTLSIAVGRHGFLN